MFPVILLIVILLLTLIYLNGKYNESYWKKRGVVFYSKHKVLGPFWDFLTNDRALFEIMGDLYKTYEHLPAVGIGSILTPSLFVIDPKNIQFVLQSDAQSFNHRGVAVNDHDKLADSVPFMNGVRWKLMRQKMTPLFTAAKLKKMFYIMDKSAQDFIDHLKNNPNKLINTYETINEFCSAAIAAAVFGIGTESTFESPFLNMARAAVAQNWKTDFRFTVASVSARLSKFLGITLFKEQEGFFIDAVKQVLRAREKGDTRKHDFADVCVNLQKAGTMRDDETGLELEPTDELLAAQGFFFFIAGVEPAASGMFGALIELGKYPEILKKVQNEIDEVFEKNNGELSYEIVNEMTYLDKVLSEALRIHTPIGFLTRQSVKDTVLPVGNIKISKGTRIMLPLFEMHFNSKYFPDPEVFDPERFSPENRAQSEIAYMPFGKGNRICIGARYSRIQILTGLIYLLRHYDVKSFVNKNSKKYSKAQFQVRRIDTEVQFTLRQ